MVGTAKSGTGLRVVGELKSPIYLKFGRCATCFKCRLVVLEGLSMPFNINGPFLSRFGIDQLHSEGALQVQGKKIPLVACLDPAVNVKQDVSNLYVTEEVTVSALRETTFNIRPSAVKDGSMSAGDSIATGSVHFSEQNDLKGTFGLHGP
jgi:hypothetical protein